MVKGGCLFCSTLESVLLQQQISCTELSGNMVHFSECGQEGLRHGGMLGCFACAVIDAIDEVSYTPCICKGGGGTTVATRCQTTTPAYPSVLFDVPL